MGRMIDADEAKCHQMTFAVKGKEKKMQDREMDLLEWVTKHTLEEIEEKWGMKVETVAEKGKKMETNQSQYEKMCEVYERYKKGDLVPVVRCKDCQWCHGGYCEKDDDIIPFGILVHEWENFYCTWGERK